MALGEPKIPCDGSTASTGGAMNTWDTLVILEGRKGDALTTQGHSLRPPQENPTVLQNCQRLVSCHTSLN